MSEDKPQAKESAETDVESPGAVFAEGTDGTEGTDESNQEPELAGKKKRKRRWPIVVGVILVVFVAAGAGLWVWHEEPSFCNAICHVPMDPYLETWADEPNSVGVDKYGNEVDNTNGMLVVTHKLSVDEGGAGADCLSCHVPTIEEQISEATHWITGDYTFPLKERDTADLTKARGLSGDQFCLNESCHNLTRKDLSEATASFKRNPHIGQHGEIACSECHKAHRQSVNYCSQCHSDADIPEGWLTTAKANKLEGVS